MSAPLVLLAEDDEDVRALAELVLRRAGYDVAAVGDGEAALAAAAERTPAVAVLDVSMPRSMAWTPRGRCASARRRVRSRSCC